MAVVQMAQEDLVGKARQVQARLNEAAGKPFEDQVNKALDLATVPARATAA
jgi:hypothetical protein